MKMKREIKKNTVNLNDLILQIIIIFFSRLRRSSRAGAPSCSPYFTGFLRFHLNCARLFRAQPKYFFHFCHCQTFIQHVSTGIDSIFISNIVIWLINQSLRGNFHTYTHKQTRTQTQDRKVRHENLIDFVIWAWISVSMSVYKLASHRWQKSSRSRKKTTHWMYATRIFNAVRDKPKSNSIKATMTFAYGSDIGNGQRLNSSETKYKTTSMKRMNSFDTVNCRYHFVFNTR